MIFVNLLRPEKLKILILLIVVIFITSTTSIITTNILTESSSQSISVESIKNSEIIKNLGTSPLIIGESLKNSEDFEFKGGHIQFVLYQDFTIQKPDSLNYDDIFIFNALDNVWIKLLKNSNNENKDHNSILRMMGAVTPDTLTPINNTVYIVSKLQNDNPSVDFVQMVKNRIIEEIHIVRDSIPMKFKNEILTPQNSKLIHIFGIVYDPEITFGLNMIDSNDVLDVNIKLLGLMENGKIIETPEWLNVEIMNLPLQLEKNIPEYYIFGISINDAPLGSYEIVLEETINQKTFIETVIITVI